MHICCCPSTDVVSAKISGNFTLDQVTIPLKHFHRPIPSADIKRFPVSNWNAKSWPAKRLRFKGIMWWWVSFRVFELFVPRIWRICRFWPQAWILWGRGCFAACFHGCLNTVCSPACFVNTILAVSYPERQNNALFLLESVAPLHIYTFNFFPPGSTFGDSHVRSDYFHQNTFRYLQPPSVPFALSQMMFD